MKFLHIPWWTRKKFSRWCEKNINWQRDTLWYYCPRGPEVQLGEFLFCQILYLANFCKSLIVSCRRTLLCFRFQNQIYSLSAFLFSSGERKTEGKYQFVVLLNSWIILSDPWTNKLWCVSTLQEQKSWIRILSGFEITLLKMDTISILSYLQMDLVII